MALVIGASVIGGAIYFSSENTKDQLSKICQNIPELKDKAVKLVTKVIDGYTFLIEEGYSVKILEIDADERGYPCYDEAKNRLEELILNKEVRLVKETEEWDQYCRYLRHVFVDNQNIGLELVKAGLAVAHFSSEDVKYREEITQAEKSSRESKTGCKWSPPVKEKTEFQWEKLTPELRGLKIIGSCQAGNYYGKKVIAEGKIADVYRSKTNTIFLNFEKAYPNQCFTAVIFSSDQYKFVTDLERYYSGKTARIEGEVKEYQGKPEIILKDPSQIEIGK